MGVDAVCHKIANKLASVSYGECDNGLQLTGAASVEGIPLLMKEYPPLPPRTPQARVLLIGGIHGDEYSSVSIVFKWMQTLDTHHSGLFHWKVIPLLNPDGLLQKRSQRMNARGVDLNRNFPTHDWHRLSKDYWENRTRKNPRRYPGSDPLSEPETRWLHQLVIAFQPDVIVSVHAPFGLLDFDGKSKPPQRLGDLNLHQLGVYPGSMGNYAGIERDIPVVTIELRHAGIMPSPSEISRIWVDLVQWLSENTPVAKPPPPPPPLLEAEPASQTPTEMLPEESSSS
ncbi:MAG: murein peptide amidase A [Gammaproteobacteria bacterium]|nr:murein peptide amidase A [Gammaproteobacteria bacterium]